MLSEGRNRPAHEVGVPVRTAQREHPAAQCRLAGRRGQHQQAHGVPAGRVAPVKTYSVRARPWEHGWELHIDGLGVTQSRTLRDAGMMARDYIALDLDVPEDSFDVDVSPEDPRLEAIWRLSSFSEDVRAGMVELAVQMARAAEDDRPGQESA